MANTMDHDNSQYDPNMWEDDRQMLHGHYQSGSDTESTSDSAEAGPSSSSSPSSDSNTRLGRKRKQRICKCSYCTRLESRLDVEGVSDAGLRFDAAANRRNMLAPATYDDDDHDGLYLSRQQLEDESRAYHIGHKCTTPDPAMKPQCFLQDLPVELIDNILSYLSPFDLAAVTQTSRFFYHQANQDRHWQALIQASVPGVTVASPHPFSSFRELYVAHDPHWFLTKQKLWFSGRDLMGRLIIVRFNPKTGGIEGHQMVAISNRTTYQHWSADDQVIIHSFEPEVRLHMHKPVLSLPAQPLPSPEALKDDNIGDDTHTETSRFATETTMPNPFGQDGMFSTFSLAKSISRDLATRRAHEPFPYGRIWPAPSVPARNRIAQYQSDDLEEVERPSRRGEICEQGFHIHTWLEMGESIRARGNPLTRMPSSLNLTGTSSDLGRRIGEEFTTYSTLAPWMYTPTPEKPWRGIWVGDYSGHGCEFLLIHQPEDETNYMPPVLERNAHETAEDFERRQWEAKVYRGRLEAIKLTGDPNIPRGEYTFVADDIGEDGFVNVVTEEPFAGARVVRSKGHVAHSGFVDDKYIESQLILISHDRLAQYWVGFGHISFFERVDIEKLLEQS